MNAMNAMNATTIANGIFLSLVVFVVGFFVIGGSEKWVLVPSLLAVIWLLTIVEMHYETSCAEAGGRVEPIHSLCLSADGRVLR